MAYSAITQPNPYMAAYSAVPLKVYSTQYDQQELFKYLINLVWDTVVISNDQSINIGNDVYTLLTSTTPHDFNVGDTVLIDDGVNNNQFTGYYIVQKIISPTQFAIDLIPGVPFASPGFTCSRVIKWILAPDLDGYGKIDLSNTLKDFVTQNLTGQNVGYGQVYDGVDTRFCYSLYCGSEQQYTFQFDDNLFSGGSVAFFSSGTTSLDNIPFQVGDVITITQDIVEWPYNDNYFAVNNQVGFTGSTQHSFLPNQQVTITGQQTYPFYNGVSSIVSVTTNGLVINKTWQGSTPVESGFVYGVPRPEYNATCIITQIFVSPTYGVVIVTDLPFSTPSVPISGIIQYADGQITENPVELKLSGFCVYNAHIDIPDYSLSAFDPYVVQVRNFSGNNISTIFNQDNCYRVEPNTNMFLLTHSYNTTYVDGLSYTFYNNGTILGVIRVPKLTGSTDWYTPAGLLQISQSNFTNIAGSFSGYSGQVTSYEVYAYDATSPSTQAQRTNKICFKLNVDCSMYEIYHLMWKDKYGSFISYPFIYMSRDNVEVERKTYYKQNGSWDDDTFQYYDYGDGEKQFYLKSRKSYVLNSGWLYEFERTLIEDLIQSASVYIQTPDNRLFQCHLAENELEIFKNINEQLFSYTFNVRVSNNEYRF
jgi:hypothetical protein